MKTNETVSAMETIGKSSVRTHRVGTITTGLSMIVFGILFLLHLLAGMLSYEMIFSLWPLMLVGLGLELLISHLRAKQFVYDKAAVFLLICMTFFVMAMAAAEVCLRAAGTYMQFTP